MDVYCKLILSTKKCALNMSSFLQKFIEESRKSITLSLLDKYNDAMINIFMSQTKGMNDLFAIRKDETSISE